jgi:threonine/homoserine/homoserine lactone efflux protein
LNGRPRSRAGRQRDTVREPAPIVIAAFLGVSALVIVAPGPDTALTLRNAVFGSRGSGVATAAGVATGQALWAIATAAGVAALLRASEPAFLAVKLAGACYLVYLGGRALRASIRRRSDGGTAAGTPVAGHAFRQGLLSNLGNPKMAVFFTSLLPQFAGSHASFAALLALGLVFAAMTLLWLSGYAVVAARLGQLLRRSRARRALDALTGVVLVGLGLRLATEPR